MCTEWISTATAQVPYWDRLLPSAAQLGTDHGHHQPTEISREPTAVNPGRRSQVGSQHPPMSDSAELRQPPPQCL